MFHAQPPDFPSAVEPRNDRSPAAAGGEKPSGVLGIPDGGGQSDAAWTAAGQAAQAFDQTEGLQSAVRPEERMDFVDHNESQIPKQGGNLHMFVDEHGLEGFGRDLQNAGGMPEQFLFSGHCGVPVPAGHDNAFLLAEFTQASELIVDQGFERGDIQHTDGL